MSLLLIFLGLLPIIALPDVFGAGDDDGFGNGTSDGETDVLQPDITDDIAPITPIDVDDDGILRPDEDDDSADEFGNPIGDGDVQDPNDTPEEEFYIDGDGSLLQQLLGEQSDATTGIGFLGTQISDTDDTELGADDNSFALEDDGAAGNGQGDLGSWDGTPIIETPGDLNVIDAGAGDDTVTLGDEAAYVFGGAGDDEVFVGDGAAAVFGGIGSDTIHGSDVVNDDGTASAYLDGGAGNDLIIGGDGHEIIEGGEHGDDSSVAGDDTLYGGGGNDLLRGGYGADTLNGGTGDDVIDHHGHADERVTAEHRDFSWHIDNDADTLDGGDGNDTLIFDRADTATGGSGNDTFWLYHDTSSGVGHAEITDFTTGEDFLRISLNPEVTSGTPDISVEPSADGLDGVVTVNGEIVAVLVGTPGATSADIYVDIPENIFA